MTSTTAETGSAGRWGRLWGARPHDWAVSEEQQRPTYEDALARVGLRPGQAVLDVGCGAGAFLRLAADRGGVVSGVDASEALLEVARTRVPEADLRVGEMQALPYPDDTFDVVTGFNAFFFAADIVAALREAGRVARPGAPVVIQVWGPPERCDLETVKRIIRSFQPAPPPGAPAGPALWEPGVLEGLATAAGLAPRTAYDTRWAYEYAGEEALGRAMLAPAGLAALVGPEREDEVRGRIVDALAPHRGDDGVYRLRNEFHTLIARA